MTARASGAAPTSTAEFREHHRPGRPAGARSTPQLKALATSTASSIRAQVPEDQAARLGLQPRPAAAGERLQRRARAGRLRRHLRADAAGRGAPGAQARPSACWWCSAFPTSIAAGDARARGARRRADRLRRARRAHHRRPARARAQAGRHRAAAARQGLADGRVRRRHAARRRVGAGGERRTRGRRD